MLTAEPETMLPFMTVNGGPLVAALRDFLAGHLMRSRVQHSMSEADVPVVSEMMVRLSISFLLTRDSRIDLGSDEALRDFARRRIVPMVLGRP